MPLTSSSRTASLRKVSAEIAESFLRGDDPRLSDWQKRHPEFSKDLERLFQNTVRLRGAASPRQLAPAEGGCSRVLEHVGDYHIVREIGRGGMGVVYEAEQRSLGRRVALKILPPHVRGDGQSLDRFRREARSAARLHHTNIVPVFEVGQEGDICYYAMQFIEGQSLEQRVTQHQAAAASGSRSGSHYRDVARMGVQVADGLAYAHARGIVHRDIKPSNLLVDPSGTVWITDFGLAKSAGEDVTVPGDLVGTLRYMAPERFQGNADHRVDIYALGLTLYEVLLLRPAFDATDHVRVMDQVQRTEPPRPRDVDPQLPRDLETILLKAIDKDPARRYQSAAEFGEDLRRFLADEPIQARRVGPVEKIIRSARRNPRLATLAGLVIVLTLTLALGAIVAAISFRDLAAQERALAESARRSEAEALKAHRLAREETQRANHQTETAQEISTFLLGLLEEADPLALAGRGLTPRKLGEQRLTPLDMLNECSEKLKTALLDRPAVRAALLAKVGAVYVSYAQFSRARPILEEALALRQKVHPEDHAEIAESWQHLGYFHQAQNRHQAAAQAYQAALDMRRRLFGPDHPAVAETLVHFGFLKSRDPSVDAGAMLRRACDIQARHFGKKSREYGTALVVLVQYHFLRREMANVLPLIAECDGLVRELGGTSKPAEAVHHLLQGQLARQMRLYPLAAQEYRKAIEIGEPWLGETHFFSLVTRKELGFLYLESLQDPVAAEAEFRLLLSRIRQMKEDNTHEGAHALLHLGRILRAQKRYDEAEPLLRRAVELNRKGGAELGRCLHVLAEVLAKSGRDAEAEPVIREAVAARRAGANGDHYWHGPALDYHVQVLIKLGRHDEAAAALRDELPFLDRHAKPDAGYHVSQAARRARLCRLLADRPDEAALVQSTRDQAVACLRNAVEAGYDDFQRLETSRVFAPIRSHPEFAALMKKAAR